MVVKHNLLLALTGAFFLSFILIANAPHIGPDISIIAHDGILNFKGSKNYLIDFDTMSATSMAYLSVTPQELFTKAMTLIFGNIGNEILSRIGLIPVLYLISTSFMLTRFITKSYVGKITVTLASLLIWLNIGEQWQINSGVGMFITEQLTLFFCTILFVIVLSSEPKKIPLQDLRLLVSISFLIQVVALFTFTKIIPTTLAIAITALPLLWSNRKVIFKDKVTLYYASIMLVVLTLLGCVFYVGLIYNNFQLNAGIYEAPIMGLSNAAGGNIRGGLLYQILGFNNWVIYTNWEDRLFGQMHFGIENSFVQVLLLLIFAMLPLVLITKRNNKSSLMYISLFILIALFLSKANQAPFNGLFTILVDNLRLAQSIRTPDTKFGIYISCAVIILIISTVEYLNKFQLILLSGCIIIYLTILTPPIYYGETIYGCQRTNSVECSYVTDTSTEKGISEMITTSGNDGSVLLIPGYGNITNRAGRIGWRDPLLIYLPNSRTFMGSVNSAKGADYMRLINNFDFLFGSQLGINTFFIRKSWLRENNSINFCLQCLESSVSYKKIFEDKYSLVFASKISIVNHSINESISKNGQNVISVFEKLRLLTMVLLSIVFGSSLIYLMKADSAAL